MAISLDKEYVKKVTGGSDANVTLLLPYFNKYFEQYGLTTPNRINAFLAQIGLESANLKATEEYASGAAYEGRSDLGNTQTGDGVKFKGRGLIQLTGRSNYAAFSNYRGKDFINNPYLVGGKSPQTSTPEQLENSVIASLWFWKNKNLNSIADNINVNDSIYDGNNKYWFDTLTRKINGGLNHINERASLYESGRAAANSAIEQTIKQIEETVDYVGKNPVKSLLGILLLLGAFTGIVLVVNKFSK